jgi:hypothetical protein
MTNEKNVAYFKENSNERRLIALSFCSGITFRMAKITPPPPNTIAIFAKVSIVFIIPTSVGDIILATNRLEPKTMNWTE